MSQHDATLRQFLSKYQYPDVAKRDIAQALSIYTDLRPQKDFFVYNDGRRQELLSLDGTIPVTYKDVTYNIPVCIWLLESHPYNPPMCYVKPTATMQIKPGKHVDVNGRIYLPYLHEWRHPNSDLLGLIQLLIIIFSEEPPVFSKSASGSQPSTQVRPPPYPASNANIPYPPQSGSFMPMPGGPRPGYHAPGYPSSSAATPYPPAPVPTTGYPNYPPVGMGNTPYPPNPSQPPYPSYQAPQQSAAAPQRGAAAAGGTGTVNEEQLRDSLVSAVEDKMKRRLREIFAQAQAEMDALKNTKEDLERGKATLDNMLERMRQEQSRIDANCIAMQQHITETEQSIARMQEQGSLDVDDAVMPTAPLYRQIVNTFAEENATEDAIYYLGEALRRGTIDLDVYLKHVRELSRQQFLQKALMFKARQKAGLADITA